jgi:hypothetical protein
MKSENGAKITKPISPIVGKVRTARIMARITRMLRVFS